MDRADAYAVLSNLLNEYRRLPTDELVGLIGQTHRTSTTIGHETVEIEVRVRWSNLHRESLCIDAVANGPSCWRFERLEETTTVSLPESFHA